MWNLKTKDQLVCTAKDRKSSAIAKRPALETHTALYSSFVNKPEYGFQC